MARFANRWLVFALMTAMLWGAWATLSKAISDTIDPYTSQLYFSVGLLPMAFISWRRHGASWRPAPRGAVWALATGLAGGLGNIAFFAALSAGGKAVVVTPITALSPLVTLLLAIMVIREKPTTIQVCGVFLAILSIFLLSI